MQPPPLATIARGEVSFYACFKFSRQGLKLGIIQTLAVSLSPFFNPLFGCFALRFPAGQFRISLV